MPDGLSIEGYINVPDLLALANATVGFASIIMIFYNNLSNAAMLMVLAVVLGIISRLLLERSRLEHQFGRNLNNFVDIISFAVAPALLVWANTPGLLAVVFPLILIFGTLLKFARQGSLGIRESHIGMPAELNGIIFPALFFILQATTVATYITWAFCVISALLMIAPLKVPRLT